MPRQSASDAPSLRTHRALPPRPSGQGQRVPFADACPRRPSGRAQVPDNLTQARLQSTRTLPEIRPQVTSL